MPSSIFLATRLKVSSARSSGNEAPRHLKNLISIERSSSYSSPARSGSGSRRESSLANAVSVNAHIVSLSPLALKHERAPIKCRLPLLLFPHLDLRLAQRRRRAQTVAQHSAIEPLHQFCCRHIVHLPEARHNACRAGIYKSAG